MNNPHNNKPKRLTIKEKKDLTFDTLSNNNLSNVARAHNVTNKTARLHKKAATNIITKDLEKVDDTQKVLFYIPVTTVYLRMIIVLLFTVCQCSTRNIRKFMRYALDTNISNGNVVSVLDDVTKTAKIVNDSYDLSICKNSATDELYHQSKPVLASVDLDSKFCMSLSPEDTRDGIVWGCHLLDMMSKGYAPDRNVMDGGTGMKWAFKELLPHAIIGRDHWHIIDESNNINRYLKNKKETAITNAINDSNNIDATDLGRVISISHSQSAKYKNNNKLMYCYLLRDYEMPLAPTTSISARTYRLISS